MMTFQHSDQEDPWTGAPKWVKVKDREDIGRVVDPGKNIGTVDSVRCLGVLFESTGQICSTMI